MRYFFAKTITFILVQDSNETYLFSRSKSAISSVSSHGPRILHARAVLMLEERILVWHTDGHTAGMQVPRTESHARVITTADGLVGVDCGIQFDSEEKRRCRNVEHFRWLKINVLYLLTS